MKYKLLVPSFDISGKYRHENDTSRELFSIWEQQTFVNIEYSKDIKHPYLFYKNKQICLFEWDRFDFFSEGIDSDFVLFACPSLPNKFKYESSWIYWGRHPKQLENSRNNLLTYQERNVETFFAGRIENQIQYQNRTVSNEDWSKYIEDFSCPINEERKYTQQQYLDKLKHTKFGLCLPGFGNKCNREIELLGLGTVPIITKGVDVSNYFEPLIENVHYIYAENGEDLIDKINKITEEEWIYLSQSGLEWYDRNCSPRGSFETTLKIIDKLMKSPESFSTLATKTAEKDLDLFYYSLRLQYPKHDVYLACDDYIVNWAKSKNDTNLHTHNSLEIYANKDRLKMESDGTWTDFMLEKCTAIDDALSNHNNTLFLDCDQCIINKIEIDNKKDLGLSQHMIRKQNETQFGKYNGGFIFVNNKNFTNWWRKNTPHSKYMEQGILEEAPKCFSYFEFDPQYNFGWWRLLECDNPQERANKFSYNNCLKYENKPVVTLHTHFFENEIKNQSQLFANEFNKFILDLLPNENSIKYYIQNYNKNKLVLFQSYYNPKDEGRRKEIEYCLNKNLNNPSINKVVLFLDDDSVEYPTHDKIDTYINTEGQLTYEKVFRYAQKLYSDQLCILINNDIFLDYNSFKDLTEIENLINNNIVFSLSRHEYDVSTEKGIMDESFSRMLFAHTQDAWIWKSNFIPENSNFNLGTLGCDNAINDRFKKSGKVPLNLGSKYKVYHVDQVRGKTSTNKFSKEKHAEFHDFNRETYPEERGQFLTPDYGMTLNMSLDDFSKQLGFNQIDRYELICEMMSKKIKIKNR